MHEHAWIRPGLMVTSAPPQRDRRTKFEGCPCERNCGPCPLQVPGIDPDYTH